MIVGNKGSDMRIGGLFTVFGFMVSWGFGAVIFQEDFSDAAKFRNYANAEIRDNSLDYRFSEETGGRLFLKDDSEGVIFRAGPDFSVLPELKTLYITFSLCSLNAGNKEKFAGMVFYQNGKEVFGMGNDWASEYFSCWKADGKGIIIGDVPVPVDLQVHKMVMRIDYDQSGPETVKVGLDPFCLRTEDRQPDHLWTTLKHELVFDEIRLRCGNQDCVWEFDEIRIGTDWQSVTPSNHHPGGYIEAVTRDAKPAGHAEMIGDGVACFWSSKEDAAKALPSFALEKPRAAIGPLGASWQLKPKLGGFGEQNYVYFEIPADADLYGTGEVTGSLLRNGRKIVLFNKDNYGYNKPDQLYQSHPWVMGLRPDGTSFGIIFDTPWKAELDLGAGILFTVPAQAKPFATIVMEGENPQDVMKKLADLTGRMPMPPRWALGYQQCRYSYYPDARAREVADAFRARRIPCDVIWFDIDYMDGFRVFTFDPNQYPDPKATNDYLHSMGFKSVWMIDPGVKHDPGYFVYDSGTQEDVWVLDRAGIPYKGPVWPGDCVFPDFTMPAVRTWWSGLYGAFMATGIDGVWNDMNEPAVFKEESGGTMPLDNLHRGGGDLPPGPHIQYHNVYGMLMVKASREGIQKADPGKRPFVLSRANFLGGHRYAATWTGDNNATWEHLKWSIPMSLNLSLSGQPFNGPDIGGFIGNAEPDLWAHWIAVGAFYPFCRAHTSNDTDNQEPWEFGAETENAARTALERRYRLMPYLYTVFRQSHTDGLPIMRPAFFADPTDMALRMEDQAFLIGRDLLVVPRWAEDVRLPGGTWQTVSVLSGEDLDDAYQCDLKVRGGAIVPLGPIVQTTDQIGSLQTLTLLTVLDENGFAEGTVYEDSGNGYDFEKGQFCLLSFRARREGDTVFVRCTGQDGRWKSAKRLVSVVVASEEGVSHGFGDIVTGVKVQLARSSENSTLSGNLK
jgi:alpha-glucosidase